jgi:hypothetical protein
VGWKVVAFLKITNKKRLWETLIFPKPFPFEPISFQHLMLLIIGANHR